MLPRDYVTQNCSIARTLEVLGDRWTLLIVRDALSGITRFAGFQERLGIARDVLADRLARLTEDGILDRRPYQTHPPRHEYLITDKGRDLWPVLISMIEWGDRHRAPHGPPRVMTHRGCDGEVHQRLTCSRCKQELAPADIDSRPGPGAHAATALAGR